ncbi:hypothetical protein GWN26_02080, partial [Candidatus Saccharibacteria bacterium]|nr:hypothetical protein [Calditrichia bacterium]NIV97990.1 hypothetical protein [Candidatus Saccharibacteria bacterium]NIW78468.1 hypothetical protein [Calditrichia bacterium]
NLTEGLSTREDYLQLYSAFVNYYRIRIPSWVFWWGLGFKGLQGGTARHGFAFNLGIETYLAKPISIHLNYSGGWLNTTYVPEFFGTLNVHIRRLA